MPLPVVPEGVVLPAVEGMAEGSGILIAKEKGDLLDGGAICWLGPQSCYVDLSGGASPTDRKGEAVMPLEGKSHLLVLNGNRPMGRKQLVWEHLGTRGIRQGKWKLVSVRDGKWELYELKCDRTELSDLAGELPKLVEKMEADW